jgi:hypothetical protein
MTVRPRGRPRLARACTHRDAPAPRTSARTNTRRGKEDQSTHCQRRRQAADTTRQKARSPTPLTACWQGSQRYPGPTSVFWPGASGPSWQNHWSRPLETINRGVLADVGGPDGHSTATASGCRGRADQRGAPRTTTGAHPAGCRSAATPAAQRTPEPWARGSTDRVVNISMCGRLRRGRLAA